MVLCVFFACFPLNFLYSFFVIVCIALGCCVVSIGGDSPTAGAAHWVLVLHKLWGSTCCLIICAGPALNVKCCPILGIGLNINCHELMNYMKIIKIVATRCQILRLKCT